jgi:uncharacterized protein (TIGR02145 family)
MAGRKHAEVVVRDGDGNEYRTVQIGNQVWFAENLRSSTYRNGDPIPGGLTDEEWTSTTSGAQTVYGEGTTDVLQGSADEVENLEKYGRLYNWYAVNDPRGLCPSGYHVPSVADWQKLVDELGGEEVAGEALKDDRKWDGNNSSGFSALPGGFRYYASGYFYYQGYYGYWWSSSPDGTLAWYRFLFSGYSNVFRSSFSTRYGFSVRCVRD